MTTENAYTPPDRKGWPNGPWDNEPDRAQWVTEAGYAGLIVRAHHGALCGYVGVPNGHPAYGAKAWGVAVDGGGANVPEMDDLNVHGGLTYGSKCRGAICHVPEPGMPDDVFWHGFDCAHSGDACPGLMATVSLLSLGFGRRDHGTYRDMAYVRGEVESLARQFEAMVAA